MTKSENHDVTAHAINRTSVVQRKTSQRTRIFTSPSLMRCIYLF